MSRATTVRWGTTGTTTTRRTGRSPAERRRRRAGRVKSIRLRITTDTAANGARGARLECACGSGEAAPCSLLMQPGRGVGQLHRAPTGTDCVIKRLESLCRAGRCLTEVYTLPCTYSLPCHLPVDAYFTSLCGAFINGSVRYMREPPYTHTLKIYKT